MKKLTTILMCSFIPGIAYAVALDTETPKTITSEKIEYNVKTETIKTSGETEIVNQTGQRMTLTDSYISPDGESLSGNDIKLWLGDHVYIESDNIVREGVKTIAYDSLFTACQDCDPYGNAWEITAKKIIHNEDTHMLKFFNPVLWTYDIPVMWLPFYQVF